jgi:hypothetical protein
MSGIQKATSWNFNRGHEGPPDRTCGRKRKRCCGSALSPGCWHPRVAVALRRRRTRRSAWDSGSAPRRKAHPLRLRFLQTRSSQRLLWVRLQRLLGHSDVRGPERSDSAGCHLYPRALFGNCFHLSRVRLHKPIGRDGTEYDRQRALPSRRAGTGAGFVSGFSWLRYGCRRGVDGDAPLIVQSLRPG